jgi:hypothetical protein
MDHALLTVNPPPQYSHYISEPPQTFPLTYSLHISSFSPLSETGPTNCNRAPTSGGNRPVRQSVWSLGSNNAHNTRAFSSTQALLIQNSTSTFPLTSPKHLKYI